MNREQARLMEIDTGRPAIPAEETAYYPLLDEQEVIALSEGKVLDRTREMAIRMLQPWPEESRGRKR